MDFRFGDWFMLFGVFMVFSAAFVDDIAAIPGEADYTTPYVVGMILIGLTFMLCGLRSATRKRSTYDLREQAMKKLSPEELEALKEGFVPREEQIIEVAAE